ncbi:dihydrolipoamide acetyltransferase family protein [Cohnella luojiensis]|uniref:Dihydrolipoamide acetyltransferase component of pyruvate dehydrogenase complex n=1 Tax=Cohnella luojiensis TaxID=652876 RepID=A0A4Y8LXV8_9BACL|nr:dihydrolipoamide acetyltransferase family protein [Cohnella luojiensis]TFE26260.1 2-oxo acid dehydrogenase subunit E2 [Cohnella luojiensis]
MHNEEERLSEVTIPHLAESLVSATLGRWLKEPGDYVKEYEVLCELNTDKVNVEMPSPMEGTLIRILVQEGETADVGAPICLIREPEAQTPIVSDPSKSIVTEGRYRDEPDLSTRYSPAVMRLAEEHRIDLRKVKGTSLGGRINRKDVLAYVRDGMNIQPATPPEYSAGKNEVIAAGFTKATSVPAAQERKEPASSRGPDDQLLPVTPVRKLIATRMHQSVSEIPHAWLTIEADVSHLVDLQQKWKDRFAEKEGIRLTVTPFVLKAVVNAIKDYPILNSTWSTDNIIIKKEIHVSIAIGSEESVVTPVIRNADRKTIAGLAIELDDLVKRARSGKLTISDMQGGTFTFNNTGAFGSLQSFPLINYPQAAIITFETIVRKPVVIQRDMIAIRSMANLCLSLDHRILDGVVCGHFMRRVKQYLERYDQETVIY